MNTRMPSQSFIDRADSAAFYEAWVATVLCRAGLYTLHYPFVISQDKDLTEPDLMVSGHQGSFGFGNKMRVVDGVPLEIKSLSVTFSNTLSYPFEDVLVCSQNSFIRKWPGRDYIPRDFLLVSKPTGAIIWIPAMTKVTLGKEVTDKSRNETYKAVTCNRDDLRPLSDFVDTVKDA